MNLITKKGLILLKEKLLQIEEKQEINQKELIVSRDYGDFKENAEYAAAKEKMAQLEKEHTHIKNGIAQAVIFETNLINKDIVDFGAEVTIEDDDCKVFKYKIVSSYEADLKENKIAYNSPIAQALLKKKIHEEVTVYAPRGEKNYTILNISYDWLDD